MLVREKATKKTGIAILLAGVSKVTVLGARTKFNAGDDFEWLDFWYVDTGRSASCGSEDAPIAKFRGEDPGGEI